MRIVTDNPVVIDSEFSNARGDGKARRAARKSKRQQKKSVPKGSKEDRKAARKSKRTAKKAERQARRAARKGARKLKFDKNKDGKITFKDFIPQLKKRKNPNTGQANWSKLDPTTGEVDFLPDSEIKTIPNPAPNMPPLVVANEDVPNGKERDMEVDPNGNPVMNYREEETEEVTFPDGSVGNVPMQFAEEPGMSKKLKTGLIIGGAVLVVGIIATILIVKANKKKKAAK